MNNRRALTLVELLVSVALGMILIAMGSTALVQITRVATRDTAQRRAHDDAAMIHRRLQEALSGMYHPSQMRLEADAGADGVWDSGDESLTLIWMGSMRDRHEREMDYGRSYPYELVWHQLRWQGDGAGGGELRYAISSPRRVTREHTYHLGSNRRPTISAVAQVRRDRRRDMDDNDLRWIPGIAPAAYAAADLDGDAEDLADNLMPLHPPTTQIVACTMAWVDTAGYMVRCDPASGISITDSGGGVVPTLGTTFSSQTRHVVDGTFIDGRDHIAAGGTRRAMAERPALVRLALTLVPTTSSGLDLAEEPHLDFSFSFTTAGQLPTL